MARCGEKRPHTTDDDAKEDEDDIRQRANQRCTDASSGAQKRARFSIDHLLLAVSHSTTPSPVTKELRAPLHDTVSDEEDLSVDACTPEALSSTFGDEPPSPHSLRDGAESSSVTVESPSPSVPIPEHLKHIGCRLEGAELWAKFFDLGTEMIITKSGRRMFPTVKASITDVDMDALYYVFLDVIPVDNKRYRYIYNKSSWLTAGKAEPAPKNRVYMHPDSPFSGEQLLKQVVSFEKAKLTNNEVDKTGHLILNSMHKYQPRIHVVKRERSNPMDAQTVDISGEPHRTFQFPETQFMAVTAYQNQLITKLKIEKNPFAKGFRDPSGRSPDYDPDNRPELQPLLGMPHLYNPAMFQHALLNQCWLGKSPMMRPMAPLNPALLSQMLLSQFPLGSFPMRPALSMVESSQTLQPALSPSKDE